jgi:hypothetical protein
MSFILGQMECKCPKEIGRGEILKKKLERKIRGDE